MSKSDLQFNVVSGKNPRDDSITVVKGKDLIAGIRVGDLSQKGVGIQAFEQAVLGIASETGANTLKQQEILRKRIQDAFDL